MLAAGFSLNAHMGHAESTTEARRTGGTYRNIVCIS